VRARWIAVTGLTVVFAAAAVVVALRYPTAGAPAPEREPVSTATITRETLVDTVTVNGKLAYGPPSLAESRLSGTVTALAPIGSTVQRGREVFRIDDTPVVLLYGGVPAYRPLATGVTGRDVRQFEQNLKALGYDGFTVDDQYTAQTASVVRRWQKVLGVPETGTVELGRVFYAAGPIRIAEHKLAGGQVATGAVLSYTGTTRLVTAQIPVRNEDLAKVATKVAVELADGKQIAGTIQSVRTPDEPSGQEPMLEGVVAIPPTESADGQVKVRLTAERKENVLAVPVGALLALAEGGYGLQILDGESARIVAVTTGLFADGKVEVSGAEIREGQTVGMAR
jgi:peptidoglycan hydrolase-like protein with peptidoglycan-binding domain